MVFGLVWRWDCLSEIELGYLLVSGLEFPLASMMGDWLVYLLVVEMVNLLEYSLEE
jgi:hypothetical protein